MTVPYRADQVGSFLRPAALLEARKDPATRPERLRQLEDQAILECLARQRDLGFEIFTDGELRRSNFMSDFWEAVAGLDHGNAVARMWQVGATGSPHVSAVTGIVTQKLRQLRRLTGHELPFMTQHSPGAVKVTLPSATQFPAIASYPPSAYQWLRLLPRQRWMATVTPGRRAPSRQALSARTASSSAASGSWPISVRIHSRHFGSM